MNGLGIYELIVLAAVILLITAFFDILRSDMNGKKRYLWLTAVILVPVFGSMVYLFLGRNQNARK